MNWKKLKLAGVSLLVLLGIVLANIYDYLAINRPMPNANILVVEGWFWSSAALKEAAEEFKRQPYDWLVVVGEPEDVQNGTMTETKSTAQLAADHLQTLAIDKARMVVLPVPKVDEHQTYTCALIFRKWLAETKVSVTGINVFSLGTHARKSQVLYQRALGQTMNVGVLSGTEDTFKPEQWLLSGRGIYVVARKTLGYLYAVFWPLPNAAA